MRATKSGQHVGQPADKPQDKSSLIDLVQKPLRVPLLALSSLLTPQAATLATATLAGSTITATAQAQDERPQGENTREKLKAFLVDLATKDDINASDTRLALKAISDDLKTGGISDAREALGWCTRVELLRDDAASLAAKAALKWNDVQDPSRQFKPETIEFLQQRAAEWSEKSAARILNLALSQNEPEREIYMYLAELLGSEGLAQVKQYLEATQDPGAQDRDISLDLVKATTRLHTVEKVSDSEFATEKLLLTWKQIAEITLPGKDAVVRTVIRAFLRPDGMPWDVKATVLAAAPQDFQIAAIPQIATAPQSRREELLRELPNNLKDTCEELASLIQQLPEIEADAIRSSDYSSETYDSAKVESESSTLPQYLKKSFDQIIDRNERVEYLEELHDGLSEPRIYLVQQRLYSSLGEINRLLRKPDAEQLRKDYRKSPFFSNTLASKSLAHIVKDYTSGEISNHEFTLHLLSHNVKNPLTDASTLSEPLLRRDLEGLNLTLLWDVLLGNEENESSVIELIVQMLVDTTSETSGHSHVQVAASQLISCIPAALMERLLDLKLWPYPKNSSELLPLIIELTPEVLNSSAGFAMFEALEPYHRTSSSTKLKNRQVDLSGMVDKLAHKLGQHIHNDLATLDTFQIMSEIVPGNKLRSEVKDKVLKSTLQYILRESEFPIPDALPASCSFLTVLLNNTSEASPEALKESGRTVMKWLGKRQNNDDATFVLRAASLMPLLGPHGVLHQADPKTTTQFVLSLAQSSTSPAYLRTAALMILSEHVCTFGNDRENIDQSVLDRQAEILRTVLAEIPRMRTQDRSALSLAGLKKMVKPISQSTCSEEIKAAVYTALREIEIPKLIASADAERVPADNTICVDWRDASGADPIFPTIILPQMLTTMADATIDIERRRAVLGNIISLSPTDQEIQVVVERQEAAALFKALKPYLECTAGKKGCDEFVTELAWGSESDLFVKLAVELQIAGQIPANDPTVLAAFTSRHLLGRLEQKQLERARLIPELKACIEQLQDPLESTKLLLAYSQSPVYSASQRTDASILLSEVLEEIGNNPENFDPHLLALKPHIVSAVLGEISRIGIRDQSRLSSWELQRIMRAITQSGLSADIKSAFYNAIRTVNLPRQITVANPDEVTPDNTFCYDWHDSGPTFSAIILPQMLKVMADKTTPIERRRAVLGNTPYEAFYLNDREIGTIIELGEAQIVSKALRPYLECLAGKNPNDELITQFTDDSGGYWALRLAIELQVAGEIRANDPTVLAAFKEYIMTGQVKKEYLARASMVPELKACMKDLLQSGQLFDANQPIVSQLLDK